MTKTTKDYIKFLQNANNISKADATNIALQTKEFIIHSLKNGDLKLFEITMKKKLMPKRTGYHPKTQEKIEISAKNKIVFKASKTLTEAIQDN